MRFFDLELWEFLVPVSNKYGRSHLISFHQEWDQKVCNITGGLTLCETVRGRWGKVDANRERMIPVRIACTREQAKKIAILTCEHYDEDAVMYFRISDYCNIMKRIKT